MKLQNLAIIFLVITIPLIVILSYYLNMQQQTLKLQAEYDTKLAEATKEGIKAFEVNTVDWSEWVSEVNSQTTRNNVQAVVNTFITSLANNLHLSGTAKEYMLNYIPAIAVTMYDGYYIYAPTYVPATATNIDGVQVFYDSESGTGNKITLSEEGQILYEADVDNGKMGQTYYYTYINEAMESETETFSNLTTNIKDAKMEYRSILNNKIAYAARYRDTVNGSKTNVVVNYTLDNRIYVYGNIDGEAVDKDGYLIYLVSNTMPRAHLTTANPKNDSDIYIDKGLAGLECDNTEIEPEILEEQVLCKEESQYVIKTFKYIYDITHEKLYYDEIADNFFTIDAKTKEKKFISNSNDIKIGSDACKYKSVSILWGDSDGTTEYKKVYQALNGRDKGKWCISIKPENAQTEKHKETIDTEIKTLKLKDLGLDDIRYSTIYRDFSAINYYVEAYAFTNWVKQNLGNRNLEMVQKKSNNAIENPITLSFNIFKISATNDPEDETSEIVQHKKEVMRDAVTTNLNLAISNYNGPGESTYKLPQLTESDWEQLFSNISLITFFQGVPIGLKTYNNYAIATSTTNREYVDPGELYFSGDDINYHRVNCEKCGNVVYTGYRSVEYVQKEFVNGTDNIYYYQHNDNKNGTSRTACYYCAVNKSNYKQTIDKKIAYLQEKSYNEALSRERYYQKQTLDGKIAFTVTYEANRTRDPYIVESVTNINPNVYEVAATGNHTVVSGKPETKTYDDIRWNLKFRGWNTKQDGTGITYKAGDRITNIESDIILYGQWEIDFTSLDWQYDYFWKSTYGPDQLFDERNYSNCGAGGVKGFWKGLIWDGSISYIWVNPNIGNTIQIVGNGLYDGKGACWANFDGKARNHDVPGSEKVQIAEIQEITFRYDLDFGDSIGGAGLLLNLSGEDNSSNVLSGKMLSFNFINPPDSCGESNIFYRTGENSSVWDFTYNKGKIIGHEENNQKELDYNDCHHLQDLNVAKQGVMTIKITDDGFEIYYKESQNMTSETLVYTAIGINPFNKNSFGFFSSHYYHGCHGIGQFNLYDITITAKMLVDI